MIKSKTRAAPKPLFPIDLRGEYRSLKKKIDAAMQRVLSSGSFVLGEETRRFEDELAAYCGVKHAISVNSGTDAILLALRAIDLKPGDEVVVPAMTFIATAEPIVQLGARPVFVDMDSKTYNIDPRQVEAKLTPRTRAIIVVHLYGQPVDLDPLVALAKARKIPLIEDMAQAIGSEYNGRKIGSFGVMSCLSFYPTKNMGAYGDGGAVLTSDDALAFRLQRLRNHGARVKYDHEEIGYTSRLDELQSAILRIKLPLLDRWNQKRIELADEYDRLLEDVPVQRPFRAAGRQHVFHLYSICTPQRDALNAYLKEQGIYTGMHYPKPLHLQTALRSLGGKPGDFPNSERLAHETLSLPLYPQLSKQDVGRVAKAVSQFFKTHGT